MNLMLPYVFDPDRQERRIRLLQIFVEPSDRLFQSIGLVLWVQKEMAFSGIDDELRRHAQRL